MTNARLPRATLNGDGLSKEVTIGIPEGTWVATLSDGSTITEHSGDFKIIPGERKPWVRLCNFMGENKLWITSLRFNYRGRTIHLPRAKFEKFNLQERVKPPIYYSLQYHHEAEMTLGGQVIEEWLYVDLAAHYPDFAVHFIQDVTNGNNSWIVVTDPDSLAPSPLNKDLVKKTN